MFYYLLPVELYFINLAIQYFNITRLKRGNK